MRNDVAIEDFGERSLVLRCDALELREINAAARRMLALLDGERTVADIAGAAEMAVADVAAALREMERQGIVRQAVVLSKERPGNVSEARFLADPDVSFRPEDDDGGILYDAEADVLEVINPTAAEIWKFLAAPRTPAEVVAHLLDVCDGADRAQVERDVRDFLESMRNKGFIGTVAEPA
ncbi:MAG TPA: PqqD family peptide modification chaperone [Kiritimatiellia bacterium]|nr:PqqD family peptide modification chaperone [Kiritimatiellia bacterium]